MSLVHRQVLVGLLSLVCCVQPALSSSNEASAAVVHPQTVTAPAVATSRTRDVLAAYIASTYRKPFAYARHIVDLTYEAAQGYSLPPSLVLAMMAKESAFDTSAHSSQGAVGLLQVIPKFHRDRLLEGETDQTLQKPGPNIRVACAILADLMHQEGTLEAALKRYSGNALGYPQRIKSYWKTMQAVEALQTT